MSELPAHWRWVSVGGLGDVTGGLTQNSKREGLPLKLPYLRVANVYANELRLDQVSEIGVLAAEVPRALLTRGDLLVVEGNGSIDQIGRVAVWSGSIATCLHQNHLIKVRFVPAAIGRFALYWFLSSSGRAQITRAASSTSGLHTLSISKVQSLEMPLAPLLEQERVEAALESYFTRLDDAVATLERVERNLKRYRASVLKSAVEGRLVPTEAALAKQEGRDYEPASALLERILTERRRRWVESGTRGGYLEPTPPNITNLPDLPEGWCWASIDQVGDVSGGVTKNAKRDDLSVSLPYLRVANVYANELRLDEIKQIGLTKQEMERVLLKKNDLLVVEGNGSLDQIGRVALWDGSIDPCVHQNHLIKIRFNDATLPEWALTWLLSPEGRLAIQQVASSTSGLHTLSISKIARLPVPLCPESERRRISDEIARGASLLSAAEQSTAVNRHRCTRLRQSILKWAFEGKLADQDPSDEPASVLLARIKAERDKTQPAKKKSRV